MEGSAQSQRRKSLTKAVAPAKKILGRRIKVKTVSNEEIEGRIYTYDRLTNCIALDILFIPYQTNCSTATTLASNSSNGSRKGLSFRILKISHIKEILSNEEDSSSDLLPINLVNVERLDARESNTLRSRQQRAAKMGVGVTKEAQDIFDALCKTLPCRWSNDTIVVLDEVIIVPPYHVDSCKANASSAASLARVKKVLEGERRRLERKQ